MGLNPQESRRRSAIVQSEFAWRDNGGGASSVMGTGRTVAVGGRCPVAVGGKGSQLCRFILATSPGGTMGPLVISRRGVGGSWASLLGGRLKGAQARG